MNVVIMAGGKGSRLGGMKKPLLEVCGVKLIDRALTVAKTINGVDKIFVCVGKDDLNAFKDYGDEKTAVVLCPGQGYVEDLIFILKRVSFPVLVLPADIPFLSNRVVMEFLNKALECKTDVATLNLCKGSECGEVGISLFRGLGGSWCNIYFDYTKEKELRDIDTYEDLQWAMGLCESMEDLKRLE